MGNEIKNWMDYMSGLLILISIIIVVGALSDTLGLELNPELWGKTANISIAEKVLSSEGVILPVVWGDLGAKLISSKAIDAEKFKSMYEERGVFTNEYENLLLGQNNDKLKITKENAGYLLNLFWALGLANKNPILDSGEMTDKKYGGAETFASTAGWTMAVGSPMDHYSMHKFFDLTPREQAMVDKVSKGVYRPCCGNPAHFPDCNHGMAMLGLLELMASQGASEKDMWEAALAVNSYWFPDTYLLIDKYLKINKSGWHKKNPETLLGREYSSLFGYERIMSEMSPSDRLGNSSC